LELVEMGVEAPSFEERFDHGAEPEIVEYLKDPPSVAELETILEMLDMEPRDLIRRREKEYKELGLGDEGRSRQELIRAMVDHPRLIERPVAIFGDRAVLGRPTERVLELL
jgi:arsenate reductase